jgi:hypothetical protein
MDLLKQSFLYGFVKASNIKLIYFSIIYKLLTIFNYSSFFYFKLLTIKARYFRLYLLNVNFYFLFIDYIYIINYISFFSRNVPRVFSLPVKMNSYSVLRSPFVFSKSREDFVVNHYCLFFNISILHVSTIYFLFLDKLLANFRLDNSKF